MAELQVVRHAQAAFGTEDYDRLTELGMQQARWLGEFFAESGAKFDHVLTGTLRRHRETLEGISACAAGLPAAQAVEALNEYHADRLVAAYLARHGLPPVEHGADRRAHFRLLREVLYAWVDGSLDADGHLSFDDFAEGLRQVLAGLRAGGAGRVLVVSSGGPISTMIAGVLGLAPRLMVELNLQTRNTGISELRAGKRNTHLVCFNAVPHLERPGRREAITYS